MFKGQIGFLESLDMKHICGLSRERVYTHVYWIYCMSLKSMRLLHLFVSRYEFTRTKLAIIVISLLSWGLCVRCSPLGSAEGATPLLGHFFLVKSWSTSLGRLPCQRGSTIYEFTELIRWYRTYVNTLCFSLWVVPDTVSEDVGEDFLTPWMLGKRWSLWWIFGLGNVWSQMATLWL